MPPSGPNRRRTPSIRNMQLRSSFFCLVTLLLDCVALTASGQAPPGIQVVTTFDYPGTVISTTPFQISNRGDIAGWYVDPSDSIRGFVRFRNGTFSRPIVDPSDTGHSTLSSGINNNRTVVGSFFVVADNVFHGFFLSGRAFTQFDFGGASETDIAGINDTGDFAGYFFDNSQPFRAFVSIGGVSKRVRIPGSVSDYAVGINNADTIVGCYEDSLSVTHGYYCGAAGNITSVDFPGSTFTELRGINDKGWIVGRYLLDTGSYHGFVLLPPDTFLPYDYPNSTATSLNGINNAGFITGRYKDTAGLEHGILARVSSAASR